ncbi:hypothetical protein EXN66_Car006032 [Channa argus]|uniref:Secreted protein n=1 Tax=Channa argus TaxID=215402 RepID=A0A6G1PJ81_CHAAH|nr:hypothetical protein EXN66_Car006032 [Channa argus]
MCKPRALLRLCVPFTTVSAMSTNRYSTVSHAAAVSVSLGCKTGLEVTKKSIKSKAKAFLAEHSNFLVCLQVVWHLHRQCGKHPPTPLPP